MSEDDVVNHPKHYSSPACGVKGITVGERGFGTKHSRYRRFPKQNRRINLAPAPEILGNQRLPLSK